MTDKTQPTAHAEITAPISADLRRIERTSPVSQAVRLLREAAAELKNCHTIGGDWGDEIEALDAYNEHMAVAATLEQAEAGQAVPAPVTYMATDNACKWAWDQVREEVGTEGWTAGDSCTFYGFFLWGWNYRGQYETQRPAAPPAPAAVAVPAVAMTSSEIGEIASAWIHPGQSVGLAVVRDVVEAVLHRLRGKIEIRESAIRAALAAAQAQAWPSECDSPELCRVHRGCAGQYGTKKTCHSFAVLNPCNPAAPAQEHATQLAGQGLEPTDRQRVDAFTHFMLANCTNAELHAHETCSIRDMVGILGEWRSGAHDDYLGGQHGRELREVGGRKQGEGASLVCSGGAAGDAGDSDSLVAAPAQAQEDARDTERLDWLTFNLSGSALRAIGVVWSEHADARRAIDAARAAQGGAA